MNRVLQNTSALISVTVEVDGTATDPSPDSATVEISRDDGTVLVATTAATNAGTGIFTYQLTPTHTAQLDIFTASWVMTVGGSAQTLTTRAEVVGGFLCTLQEIEDSLSDSYTVPQLVAARQLAEEVIEDACGVAFVPRYKRDALDGTGTTDLVVDTRVTALRSASVDDVALTPTEIADVKLVRGGFYREAGWDAGVVNVEIGFVHGLERPPARISRAVFLLAKDTLVENPTDFFERASSLSTEDGTYSFVTPGVRQAATRIPEVNAAIAQYERFVGVG